MLNMRVHRIKARLILNPKKILLYTFKVIVYFELLPNFSKLMPKTIHIKRSSKLKNNKSLSSENLLDGVKVRLM